MDNKDVAKRWFNKGNNDLIAGDYILTMLDPEIDPEFSKLSDIASELSGYAVEVRYPLEVDYEITIEEAQHAMNNAKKIKEFILNKLKLS